MQAAFASSLATHWVRLRSLLEHFHETQGRVHNGRRFEEPKINQHGHQKFHFSDQIVKNSRNIYHCSQGFTSSNTKKGAIRKAWVRLSKRAGARFCTIWIELAPLNVKGSYLQLRNSHLINTMADKLSSPANNLCYQNNLQQVLFWLKSQKLYIHANKEAALTKWLWTFLQLQSQRFNAKRNTSSTKWSWHETKDQPNLILNNNGVQTISFHTYIQFSNPAIIFNQNSSLDQEVQHTDKSTSNESFISQ